MKKCLIALALVALPVVVPSALAAATPTLPLAQALAKPVDGADLRVRGRVAEDLGKNTYRIEDGKQALMVKAGPHWYHTLSLETGKTYTFDGTLHVKGKDGERKTELKLVRVWRADGARLDVRASGRDEPWKAVDKDKARTGTPVALAWRKP